MMRGLLRISALLCVMVLTGACVTSCATVSVNDLPQPGGNFRGGHRIIVEFANVLNLPDKAKVMMDGATVGVVDHVEVGRSGVDVTALIDRSIAVPSDAEAVLQQATVLGDIYVALGRPPGAAGAVPSIGPDGRIPIARTTSPPQIEDTLASLANFVASGSIQRIQNTVIGINRITPARAGQLREIATRMSQDLADLAANVETTDQWLDGVSRTAAVIDSHTTQLRYWFSPPGMAAWDRILQTSVAISTLLPSIGSIYTGGFWLVPMMQSLGIAVGDVQQSKWAVEGEYRPWRKLFTETFLPEDKYPAMNITSVQTADGRELSGDAAQVLRMLGAIP